MPEHRQNSVVIKCNRPLLLFGAVELYMANLGLEKLVDWFKRDFYRTAMGALATAIIFCMTGILLGMGLWLLITGGRRLTLTPEGVESRFLFWKKQLPWSGIRDWGIGENTGLPLELPRMYLYFSAQTLPSNDKGEKKYGKETLRVFVIRRYLDQFRETVLPYCARNLEQEPFLSPSFTEGQNTL